MIIDSNEVRALYETLAKSVESGLNATLTPKDCWMILSLLSDKHQTKYGTIRRGDRSLHVHDIDNLIDSMYSHLSRVAKTIVDEFTNDFLTKPRRKRRP